MAEPVKCSRHRSADHRDYCFVSEPSEGTITPIWTQYNNDRGFVPGDINQRPVNDPISYGNSLCVSCCRLWSNGCGFVRCRVGDDHRGAPGDFGRFWAAERSGSDPVLRIGKPVRGAGFGECSPDCFLF